MFSDRAVIPLCTAVSPAPREIGTMYKKGKLDRGWKSSCQQDQQVNQAADLGWVSRERERDFGRLYLHCFYYYLMLVVLVNAFREEETIRGIRTGKENLQFGR